MGVVEVVCSDDATHRERLARRVRGIEGLPEPSWDDVLGRRDEWEPWVVERPVVDSMRELDGNVARALEYLRSR